MLIFIFDELLIFTYTILDEIFVPLLSFAENHKDWPECVAQDVQKHVHSLKSTVYQVRPKSSSLLENPNENFNHLL